MRWHRLARMMMYYILHPFMSKHLLFEWFLLYTIRKGGRKCIKHFIKHRQIRMFDKMFDTFEMNVKLKKKEKIVFDDVWRCLMKFAREQTFHQTFASSSNKIYVFDAFELNIIKHFIFRRHSNGYHNIASSCLMFDRNVWCICARLNLCPTEQNE